jgi:hypothetical protein
VSGRAGFGKSAALTGVLLFAAVALAYSRAPTLPYIWDDRTLIEENPLIREPGRLAELLGADLFSGAREGPRDVASEYFRPVTTLGFWLEARLFGPDPAAGHAANVLLHALAALLVLLLLRELGAGPGVAAVCAAFFALNPIQTEAVYWISARGEILALVLALCAALALVRGTRPAVATGVAAGLFFLSLLSKETALAALPLIAAAPLLRPDRPSSRQAAVTAAGCALAVGAWLLWRWRVGVFVPGDAGLTGGSALVVDFLTVASTLARWSLSPFGLSAAHDHAPGGPATLAGGAAGLLFAAAVASLAWRRGHRLPAAALAALVCHFALVALAIRGLGVIGERYAYPVTLYLALFAAGVLPLVARLPALEPARIRQAAFASSLVLIAALFGPVVWVRAGVWRSERTLFADAVAATGASEAKRLLASHLAHREGDFAGAAALYRERVEARPGDARSWNNLAACLIEVRRFEEARAAAAMARQLDPGRRSAWLNEATALASLGRGEEALALLDACPSPADSRTLEVRRMAEAAARVEGKDPAP